MIHPTAILNGEIDISDTAIIGPYSVLQGKITIGDETIIGPNVNITGNVTIGDRCKIHFGSSIGEPAQAWMDNSDFARFSKVTIGNDNVIREQVTIHGSAKRNGITSIGCSNKIYVGVHIAHDCRVMNGVTIVNNTMLAGGSQVHDDAYVSGASMLKPRARIGRGAMVEAGSQVKADIAPFFIYSAKGMIYKLRNDRLKKTFDKSEVKKYSQIFLELKMILQKDKIVILLEHLVHILF